MSTHESLARTPLYNLHLELGARMMPFAGYEMPVRECSLIDRHSDFLVLSEDSGLGEGVPEA